MSKSLQERSGTVKPVIAMAHPHQLEVGPEIPVAMAAVIGQAPSLKVDGVTWNPVDKARASQFMDTAREIRSATAGVR